MSLWADQWVWPLSPDFVIGTTAPDTLRA